MVKNGQRHAEMNDQLCGKVALQIHLGNGEFGGIPAIPEKYLSNSLR